MREGFYSQTGQASPPRFLSNPERSGRVTPSREDSEGYLSAAQTDLKTAGEIMDRLTAYLERTKALEKNVGLSDDLRKEVTAMGQWLADELDVFRARAVLIQGSIQRVESGNEASEITLDWLKESLKDAIKLKDDCNELITNMDNKYLELSTREVKSKMGATDVSLKKAAA